MKKSLVYHRGYHCTEYMFIMIEGGSEKRDFLAEKKFSIPKFRGILVCLWRVEVSAAAKSLQSCLTLCDPIDSSPPGSSVPGILQARVLEWVAIAFSGGSV